MSLLDDLSLGALNLLRRKTRTALTALSMAVGVMCIVVLISVGLGYEQSYRESVEAMGSLTKIEVTLPQSEYGQKPILNDKAVSSIASLRGVEAVTPVVQKSAYLVSGSFVNMVRVYGIDLSAAESFQLLPDRGELPEGGTLRRPEVLFTSDVAAGFADRGRDWTPALDENGDPLVDVLSVPVSMTFDYGSVSGAQSAGADGRAVASGALYKLAVTGECDGERINFTTAAFMSHEVLLRMLGAVSGTETYELLWIKAETAEDVPAICASLRDAGLVTHSLNDMLETVRTQSRQLQGMLGAMGAVAVLISALCVANTMMMSISERTREIGVLKVLGASRGSISRLFLTEALLVGLLGGVLGLGISYGMRRLLPVIFAETEVRSIIPGYLAAGGVAFAGLVAVLSALLPARRAARISANEAIRTE